MELIIKDIENFSPYDKVVYQYNINNHVNFSKFKLRLVPEDYIAAVFKIRLKPQKTIWQLIKQDFINFFK